MVGEDRLKATHENFSREDSVQPGSVRAFAITIAIVLMALALFSAWRAGSAWPWLAGAAVALVATGYLFPKLLGPLNYAWFRLGMLLHGVVNPVIMGLLFYGAILPTALVMRVLGSNLLRLRRPRSMESYWVARRPPGPAAESMKDQF
jgi:hypothetical protein